MSVRFFDSHKTTGSNAAASESASACPASDNNALLLTLDTVITVSIFVITALLLISLHSIVSIIISAAVIVSLIRMIRVNLKTQFLKRPKPLTVT